MSIYVIIINKLAASDDLYVYKGLITRLGGGITLLSRFFSSSQI